MSVRCGRHHRLELRPARRCPGSSLCNSGMHGRALRGSWWAEQELQRPAAVGMQSWPTTAWTSRRGSTAAQGHGLIGVQLGGVGVKCSSEHVVERAASCTPAGSLQRQRQRRHRGSGGRPRWRCRHCGGRSRRRGGTRAAAPVRGPPERSGARNRPSPPSTARLRTLPTSMGLPRCSAQRLAPERPPRATGRQRVELGRTEALARGQDELDLGQERVAVARDGLAALQQQLQLQVGSGVLSAPRRASAPSVLLRTTGRNFSRCRSK